ADLHGARPPWVHAREVVDDDRGAFAPGHVAVLLRLPERVTGYVDRVELDVVAPADGHDMGRSVLPHGRDAAETTPVVQIRQLTVAEDAGRHQPPSAARARTRS